LVLKSLVIGGLYHAFIPLSAVREELAAGLLEARTLTAPEVRRQLILAIPSNRTNTRATETVIGILTSEVAAMIQNGEWDAKPGSDLPSEK